MSEAENVAVMYVGRKADATDNIGGSGKQWKFRGEVINVTMAAAQKLCNYPDQWWPAQDAVPSQAEVDAVVIQFSTGDRSALKELVEIKDAVAPELAEVAPVIIKKSVPVAPKAKPNTVAQMDEKELRKYAKKEHGATLKAGLTLKKLRFEVEGLDRTRDGE